MINIDDSIHHHFDKDILMSFAQYDDFDALGLAELVRKKEVAPIDLVDEAIARIERVNPTLNAVVIPMFEEARRRALGPLPDGPFRGVPFLLKDLRAAYAGVPLRAGSRLLHDYVPKHDAEIVTRYKDAGLVICGKTNTPEFGILPVTEPDLYGPTRNPWNPAHTSGGSSGGTASAVAGGIVPAAQGGDGGGSIRIPASCCGLFGFKPSRGRMPSGPDESELFFGFATEHVLSRTVRDSAALLDVAEGPELTSLYHVRAPERPFLHEVGAPPGRLKIAFTTKPFLPAKARPEVIRATEEAAALLGSLGHDVEEARPDFDGHELARNFFLMFCAGVATELVTYHRVTGRKVTARDVEPSTFVCGLLGANMSAGEFGYAFRKLREAQRTITRFHKAFDLVLTPTLAQPPLRVGALKPKMQEALLSAVGRASPLRALLRIPGLVDAVVDQAYAFTPFTPIANVTGQPSMSVPFAWTADDLPIGVMLTGRLGEDATLLRVAAQMEAARPWAQRRPRVHASRAVSDS
ncbi:MAG: amidase [Polyangiaceae bacterium]